jgi:hypothetical protein
MILLDYQHTLKRNEGQESKTGHFPGISTSESENGIKRVHECEFGGFILYSYTKIQQ